MAAEWTMQRMHVPWPASPAGVCPPHLLSSLRWPTLGVSGRGGNKQGESVCQDVSNEGSVLNLANCVDKI